MIKAFLISLVAMAVFGVAAANPIEGAFGYKFGDQSGSVSPVKNDGSFYHLGEFFPQQKSRFFDRFFWSSQPGTRQIHTLVGLGRSQSLSDCESDAASVLNILKTKYGRGKSEAALQPITAFKNKPFPVSGTFQQVAQTSGRRDVEIACTIDPGRTKDLIDQSCFQPVPYDASALRSKGFFIEPSYDRITSGSRLSKITRTATEDFTVMPFWIEGVKYWPVPTRDYSAYTWTCSKSLRQAGQFRLIIRYTDHERRAQVPQIVQTIMNDRLLNTEDAEGL